MTSRLRIALAPARPILVAVVLVAIAMSMGACSSSGSDASPTAASSKDASGATCGVHDIDGVQVRTFCGAGTAKVTSSAVVLSLPKAECDTGDDYVSVNAGTIVLGNEDAAAKKVRSTTQYIGLNVGQVPGDTSGTPASKDGTYTGAILSANDKGTALLAEATSLKVILTGNRTAGTFSGPLVGGGTIAGSFTCA